jgi:hypothetical protein
MDLHNIPASLMAAAIRTIFAQPAPPLWRAVRPHHQAPSSQTSARHPEIGRRFIGASSKTSVRWSTVLNPWCRARRVLLFAHRDVSAVLVDPDISIQVEKYELLALSSPRTSAGSLPGSAGSTTPS